MPLELALRLCEGRKRLDRANHARIAPPPRKRDEVQMRPDGSRTTHIKTLEGLTNFLKGGIA